MWRRKIYLTWGDNAALDSLHRHERAAAIDIGALMVTFFSILA